MGEVSRERRWEAKADENIAKWGLQEVDTLLLAIQEETGETARAYLEATHEGGDSSRIREELDDLAALCIQLDRALDEESDE